MNLPEVIEIIPPAGRVEAAVGIPGSKSITNRAMVMAALANGVVRLPGAVWSDDTEVMAEGLRTLGFSLKVEDDPSDGANRVITIEGRGGEVPRAGTAHEPLPVFVGNAGTAARFLTAFVCLGRGVYLLHGEPRMHERPNADLFSALRRLGYRIDTPNESLPAVIHGTGPRPGAACTVSVTQSSQFASALILCQRAGGWSVEVAGANDDELPYVEMTRRMRHDFPWPGGEWPIEPDASSASYFWGADWLLRPNGSHIVVTSEPRSGWQADENFLHLIARRPWRSHYSRRTDLADSIMTAIVLAPFAPVTTRFADLGRLRVQECERVTALRTELQKCGARVIEEDDTLTIHPGPLHGAEIETYNDHRMAMCFGMLGLRVAGVRVRDPGCVRKTFPNFFEKLALLGAGVTPA